MLQGASASRILPPLSAGLTGHTKIIKISRVKARQINQIVPSLVNWFTDNARDLPWRTTRDPYAIWISEIMLQQTQVKTVIPYFERWMKRLPTLEAFAKAQPQVVLKMWEGLGYYSRVRNAQTAAKLIMERHGGKFPERFEDILALPGIGRYTAGAISSIAFNRPEPILDGNVIRVLSRVFGVEGDPKEKRTNGILWDLAQKLVLAAPSQCSELNQSLMELGALVCAPRQPNCPECPLRKQCFAFRRDRVEEFPQLAARPAATERHFQAFVARDDSRFLVRQRPGGVVNAHLWEFPNVEAGREKHTFKIIDSTPVCRVRHSITRYRILLEAFEAEAAGGTAGEWKTLAQLQRLPFTSAHRKILEHLLQKKGARDSNLKNGVAIKSV
jgi:A/G-specific adenine glycosylase